MKPQNLSEDVNNLKAVHEAHRKLRIAIIGVSGSIGQQTLSVCKQHADKLEVVGVSVHQNTKALARIVHEFSPQYAVVSDATRAQDSLLGEINSPTQLSFGSQALTELVQHDDIDAVVVAAVGFAGLDVAYAAACAGKRLMYANKESIVVGADLLMPRLLPGQLIPVDSEHSAIFQCLEGEQHNTIHALWLTCSGGPFFGYTRKQLAEVSVQDALKHPTWKMGAKITIDSATLMNKGLEIIEAARLFNVDIDMINVLIQPQSQIHSMVEFCDGSTKAQLGPSDMRIAIQYALSYPKRWDSVCPRLDFRQLGALTFSAADEKTFGCLSLAREAGRVGKTLPCALNAANEVANLAFRQGQASFLDIEACVHEVMDLTHPEDVESLEQLHEVDAQARANAHKVLKKRVRV